MEQLIILDYCTGSVHFYNVDSSYEPADIESLVSSLGHRTSDCSWMFTDNVKVEVHGGVVNANSRTR